MANEKTLYRAMSGDTYTDVEVLAQEAEDKAVAKSRVTWRIPGGVGGSMKYAADRATVEALFDGEVSTTPSPKTTVEPETTPEPTEVPTATATITLTIENDPEHKFTASFTNFDLDETITLGQEMIVNIPYEEGEMPHSYIPLHNIDSGNTPAVNVQKNDETGEIKSFTVDAYLNNSSESLVSSDSIIMTNVNKDDVVRVVVTIVENSEAQPEVGVND